MSAVASVSVVVGTLRRPDRHWFAEAHPELETEGWLVERPPSVLTAVVRPIATVPGLYRAAIGALVAAVRRGGRARLWILESFAARLLRQLELLHHAP